MKKLIALLLILAAILTLSSCKKNFYEPVESTELEATTVMTLKYGGRTYEVKYELYRAFFLTYKSTVDGGDDSVWSGEEKDKYISEIRSIILDKILEIYSTIALAESIGIDPYSIEVGKKVNDYIKLSVEGGSLDGMKYPGYESYEAYLAALKALHLNYSVQTLLFRYAILSDMIEEYYIGELDETDIASGVISLGELKYTRDDVKDFYDGEGCIRVLRTFVSEEMDLDSLARAERTRREIELAAAVGESAVRDAMIDMGSTTSVPELENGFVMGRYNLNSSLYGEMTDVAFGLGLGGVSPVITVHDGTQLKHYILYRAQKSDSHFDSNYSEIAYVYLRYEIGSYYADVAEDMRESVSFTSFLEGLDHSEVKD